MVLYKRYWRYQFNCADCGKIIYRKPNELDTTRDLLCRGCATTRRNKSSAVHNCIECGVELTSINEIRYGARKTKASNLCKSCYKVKDKIKRFEIKKKVIEHYGGKCTCCGENHLELLTLDHINNDGNKHRKERKFMLGTNMYADLLRNNFECNYELQVLCWNCNLAKNYYGYCPHQKDWKLYKSQ